MFREDYNTWLLWVIGLWTNCGAEVERGLSPRSVAIIHAVLHSALKNAVKWDLVSHNATKLVTRPRIERYEWQALTGDQAIKLLEVAKGSRIEALLFVALTTGMRKGELLALRWVDLNLEKGSVRFIG